jgi:aminoglycoside phosphotransferase (APT) family kinase protein
LSAVIDFGTSGVGDPSCDLAIAWTFFEGEGRDAFRAALRLDDATWRRGRGWALWKALITLAGHPGTDSPLTATVRSQIDDMIADHERDARPDREPG